MQASIDNSNTIAQAVFNSILQLVDYTLNYTWLIYLINSIYNQTNKGHINYTILYTTNYNEESIAY